MGPKQTSLSMNASRVGGEDARGSDSLHDCDYTHHPPSRGSEFNRAYVMKACCEVSSPSSGVDGFAYSGFPKIDSRFRQRLRPLESGVCNEVLNLPHEAGDKHTGDLIGAAILRHRTLWRRLAHRLLTT